MTMDKIDSESVRESSGSSSETAKSRPARDYLEKVGRSDVKEIF
jgi:hypothetical protein